MERPAVDLAAAARFLDTRFGGNVSDVVAAPRQGEWSNAYYFRGDGGDFVVRFAAVVRELREGPRDRGGVLVAGVADPTRDGGRRGVRWLPTRSPSACSASSWTCSMNLPCAASSLRCSRALDAMRAFDLSATKGYGPTTPDGNGEHTSWREYLLDVGHDPLDSETNRVTGWRSRLATMPEVERGFDEACAALMSLVTACPEIRHLVHSDLLYGNVFVSGDRVTGVFDWGCTLYGDFLYDVAWLTFWSPWYPGLDAIDVRAEALAHFAATGFTRRISSASRTGCAATRSTSVSRGRAIRRSWNVGRPRQDLRPHHGGPRRGPMMWRSPNRLSPPCGSRT